jgi:hypothetical protein
MARKGETDRRVRELYASMKRMWAKARLPCMRCGQAIDYELRYPDPASCSVGHIVAWESDVELRFDPANLQPEHLDCNKSAGRRNGRDRDMGMTSGLL